MSINSINKSYSFIQEKFEYEKCKNKESLIKYYKTIKNSTSLKVSTSEEFDLVLEKITEMETNYQTYLKTYCCLVRFFLNLCWWDTSARGAYIHGYRALAGRVAEGYENKMISLLACKHLLKSATHRSFCRQSLDISISNTHKKRNVRGFVWKISNSMGVTSYLIGTVHQGTKQMAQAKGIQEAIKQSDKFFTEKGLLYKYWKSSYFPLMSKDLRFTFILDRNIALEAYDKNKKNFVLDNNKLSQETHRKVRETRKTQKKTLSISLKEPPSTKYFTQQTNQKMKNIWSELSPLYLIQAINLWQKGDECESIEFGNQFMREDLYVLCDERTKAWLNQSFESLHSEKPLPGLIDQIRNAEKPICIAVGNRHCIGSRISLVEEFKKAGFTVSRFE